MIVHLGTQQQCCIGFARMTARSLARWFWLHLQASGWLETLRRPTAPTIALVISGSAGGSGAFLFGVS